MGVARTASPKGTMALIATAVVVFLLDLATRHAILLWGAISPAVWSGEWHRLIAPNFIHSGLPHLLFNMYAIYIFGRVVEGLVGTGRFLALFFLCGLAGFSLSLLANPGTLAVGASAAIFGLLGYTLHFRIRRLPLRPLPMDSVFLQIFGINLLIAFVVPNIDHYAHLGGLIGGILAGGVIGLPDWGGIAYGERGPQSSVALVAVERLFAGALLLLLVWAGVSPLSIGPTLGLPRLAQVMEERYGGYFLPFRATEVAVYWLPGSAGGEWSRVRDAVTRPAQTPIALGVYWRWTSGAAKEERAAYEVQWRRINPAGVTESFHVERGTVNQVDPAGYIYRRAMLVESEAGQFDGEWQVVLLVEGRELYRRSFSVFTRRNVV